MRESALWAFRQALVSVGLFIFAACRWTLEL